MAIFRTSNQIVFTLELFFLHASNVEGFVKFTIILGLIEGLLLRI